MPKYSDIKGAFINSITLDPKKGQIVTTERFVAELAKVNHFWSLREANEWITHYQGLFEDNTNQEVQSKCYLLKKHELRKVRRGYGISITCKSLRRITNRPE